MIGAFFNQVLYRPLLNILVLIYAYVPGADFGIAIILLTILIKLAFYPLGSKAIKSQKSLSELQPKIKEIQEKYKDDKEKQTKEMLELYKTEKVSPFSGCLPVLIQLPVILALYQVFRGGLNSEQIAQLYSFVPAPEAINSMFLGFIDLSKSASFEGTYIWQNVVLILLVGIVQFIQMKLITTKRKKKSNDFAERLQKQMMYFMPILIVFIFWGLPSALALYLLTTTLFTILQQYIIVRKHDRGQPK